METYVIPDDVVIPDDRFLSLYNMWWDSQDKPEGRVRIANDGHYFFLHSRGFPLSDLRAVKDVLRTSDIYSDGVKFIADLRSDRCVFIVAFSKDGQHMRTEPVDRNYALYRDMKRTVVKWCVENGIEWEKDL